MHRLPRSLLLPLPALLVAVLLIVAPGDSRAYGEGPIDGGGAVAGTVRFLGTAPAPAQLTITQDAAHCGKTPLFAEDLLVSASRGLANVVVFVDGVTAGKAAVPSPAKLDNVGCRYEPHVVAMVLGSTLQVGNSDPILHNTHARLPKSDVFNIALPMEGQVIDRTIDKMGLMKVGCDAGHGWMSAWIATFDHPYFAVTDAEGAYSIPDLPPGDYTLVMWHEKLGRRTQPLKIAGPETKADQDFE